MENACSNLDRNGRKIIELLSHREKYDIFIGGLSKWCTEWKLEKINYYDFGTVYSIAQWFEENEGKYTYNF